MSRKRKSKVRLLVLTLGSKGDHSKKTNVYPRPVSVSAGSIPIPSTRYPSTSGYWYRIDTFSKRSIPKKGGKKRGKRENPSWYTAFFQG